MYLFRNQMRFSLPSISIPSSIPVIPLPVWIPAVIVVVFPFLIAAIIISWPRPLFVPSARPWSWPIMFLFLFHGPRSRTVTFFLLFHWPWPVAVTMLLLFHWPGSRPVTFFLLFDRRTPGLISCGLAALFLLFMGSKLRTYKFHTTRGYYLPIHLIHSIHYTCIKFV